MFAMMFTSSLTSAQGVAFHGFGAVNEGMAGAATGAANDAGGALQWNPASISALERSEICFGLGIGIPSLSVSSQLPETMGGFGGGSTRGEPGAVPLPYMALVRKAPESRWTWGIGMGVIGGSRLNYAGCGLPMTNPDFNPILSPQNSLPGALAPASGYGSLNADIQILQLSPTISYQLTNKISIGFAPNITMGNISCHPLYLVQNDHLTTDEHVGLGYTDPSGTGTRWAWGGGFQVGLYYDTLCGWAFGASYKSKQWMEDLRYHIVHVSPGGDPVVETIKVGLDYPDIFSFGFSYYGWDGWLFACDVRYFMYGNTRGFDDLHWQNIWGVSLGVQRELNERLTVRGGYSFNENPIEEIATRDNVASPLIQQHGLYLGASYKLTCKLTAHLAYSHMFKNSIQGDYFGSRAEAIGYPGGYVKSTVSCDTLMASFSVGF